MSLRDNLDLSTSAGRLMFNVIGAMAQFERDLIAERVKAGMARARLNGKRIGRKRRNDVDGARVAALRSQGHSWSEIARELKGRCGDGLPGLPAGLRKGSRNQAHNRLSFQHGFFVPFTLHKDYLLEVLVQHERIALYNLAPGFIC